MFVNEICSAVARVARPGAFSAQMPPVGMVTSSVRVGRILAAAALFMSPALIAPAAHAGGLQILDPSNLCSWSARGLLAHGDSVDHHGSDERHAERVLPG